MMDDITLNKRVAKAILLRLGLSATVVILLKNIFTMSMMTQPKSPTTIPPAVRLRKYSGNSISCLSKVSVLPMKKKPVIERISRLSAPIDMILNILWIIFMNSAQRWSIWRGRVRSACQSRLQGGWQVRQPSCRQLHECLNEDK
jgi:hypothetical protein